MVEHAVRSPTVSSSGEQEAPGAVVRRRRVALGLTVPQLAREAGVDPNTVRAWEKGETRHPHQAPAVLAALDRLERGPAAVAPAPLPGAQAVEVYPGVTVMVSADDTARLGDLRRLYAELARLRAEGSSSERPISGEEGSVR